MLFKLFSEKIIVNSQIRKNYKTMASSSIQINNNIEPLLENDLHFGVVVSEWNAHITHPLLTACLETLRAYGIAENNITTVNVPGAFELPMGARILLKNKGNLDAVICIGCVIKGDTRHDEYINNAVALGLQNLALSSGRPCIFGVLTTENEAQATARAGGSMGNKGSEWAQSAVKMALLQKEMFTEGKKRIGF